MKAMRASICLRCLLPLVASLSFCSCRTHDVALVSAARIGDTRELVDIYTRSRDLSVRLEDGTTPLIAACKNGHYQAAELLVQWGAAVDTPGHAGFTALDYVLGCIIQLQAELFEIGTSSSDELLKRLDAYTKTRDLLLERGAQSLRHCVIDETDSR